MKQEDGKLGIFPWEFVVGSSIRIEKKDVRPIETTSGKFSRYALEAAEHLLPKNHHTSVGPYYLSYVNWTVKASLVGTVTGVLSMQSLLFAIFPSAGTLPMAAAINWILKDGLGQLGGVVFASVVNQRFDAEPKRWRLASAVIYDLSILVEVLTPVFPGHFLLIASVANIGKNIGWLSASATRAGIHRSFMRTENMADITGKAGSQTIATSVVGTALGIGVAQIVGTSTELIFPTVMMFSMAHIYCIHRAMQTVTLNTLNLQRLWLAVRGAYQLEHDKFALSLDSVSSPDKVRELETVVHFGHLNGRRFGHSVLVMQQSHPLSPRLKVGPMLDSAFSNMDDFQSKYHAARARDAEHIVHVSGSTVYLLFMLEATPRQIIKGFLHSFQVYQRLCFENQLPSDYLMSDADLTNIVHKLEESGWDVENLFLEPFRSRISMNQ